MGLIRDAIGSALGANQLNNGISGGPRLPFMNNNSRNSSQRPLPTGKRPPSHNQVDADYTNRKKKTLEAHQMEAALATGLLAKVVDTIELNIIKMIIIAHQSVAIGLTICNAYTMITTAKFYNSLLAVRLIQVMDKCTKCSHTLNNHTLVNTTPTTEGGLEALYSVH